MHTETTFRKKNLPTSGNVNDYVTHIERKYADLDRSNKTTDKKKLRNMTN